MAEWTSTHAANLTRAPGKLTIVSRILPRNATVTFDLILNLQIYDPGTAEWSDIATRTISNNTWGVGEYFTIEIDIPQQIVIPSGQPLRWRTQLRGEDSRDFLVFGLDLMEMKTMPIVP